MVNLFRKPKYKSFIEERDKALEKILLNARLDISRLLHQALQRSIEVILYRVTAHTAYGHGPSNAGKDVDQHLSPVFKEFAYQIYLRSIRLRRSSYILAISAEYEALGRFTDTRSPLYIDSSRLDEVAFSKNNNGEELFPRIEIALSRIKRDLLDAVELSALYGETQVELIDRLKLAMPKVIVNRRPKRTLKPIAKFQEAENKNPLGLDALNIDQTSDSTIQFVDDKDWNQMIEDYKGAELPPMRFFDEPIDIRVGDKDLTYAWEYEQHITHDFVEKVRAGEVTAANEAGIKDFVWVAIVDSHTDDCCLVRDGHTSSEIEELLKAGKIDADTCDAVTAPAHYNCRCRMAPIGDESPTKQEFDYKRFEEWMNS